MVTVEKIITYTLDEHDPRSAQAECRALHRDEDSFSDLKKSIKMTSTTTTLEEMSVDRRNTPAPGIHERRVRTRKKKKKRRVQQKEQKKCVSLGKKCTEK